MAENSFGFGTWKAPYWFLGPEQGMSEDENELVRRHAAWRDLGSRDLDDCVAFHQQIGDARWHGDRATPQHTWTRLISVLIGHGGETIPDRLSYQQKHWGRHAGQGIEAKTCVIELSGIAAHSQQVQRNRDEFIAPRLANITAKLREKRPELLVLYGKSALCKQAWNEIASGGTYLGQCSNGAEVHECNGTITAWTEHPNARGRGRTLLYWQAFGKELRDFHRSVA